MSILDFKHFYLVGIKGVAMTSLAQCLLDAGKTVIGSDVSEDFVTAPILERYNIKTEAFDLDFLNKHPEIDCVIYTAAHQGIDNPSVKAAISAGINSYSQAEALGELFNQKQGIAVCGVGGKSTTSAMLAWTMERLGLEPSFSVGVGEIIGMDKTGSWRENSPHFIAEADEYVVDANALKKNQPIKARFSFLKPFITICSNLSYDHPDVYPNFEATKREFKKFFLQIKQDGYLVINGDNQALVLLANEVINERPDITLTSFGCQHDFDYSLADCRVETGKSLCQINALPSFSEEFSLVVPGKFNLMNSLSCFAALDQLGLERKEILTILSQFKSTKRRFELIKEEGERKYFDDYAHHPSEVKAVIKTLNQFFPGQKKLLCFQSHTYSRTRELFADFVDALGSETEEQDEILLLKIFPSAREDFDPETNNQKLAAAIKEKYPDLTIHCFESIEEMAKYWQESTFRVAITIGAGDIYKIYEEMI